MYHISYSSSSLGCMVFICVQADGGWQYSEGWHSNSYYYYDAAAGREVTAAEYLEYFGLDAESLVKAAALSDAYLRAMGTQSYYYGETGGEELRGLIGAESASPEAYEVTAETIRVWMRTSGGYIDYSFVCDIDAASGVPCRPSYIVETSEFSVDKNCRRRCVRLYEWNPAKRQGCAGDSCCDQKRIYHQRIYGAGLHRSAAGSGTALHC